jgi:hypothetical protein
MRNIRGHDLMRIVGTKCSLQSNLKAQINNNSER